MQPHYERQIHAKTRRKTIPNPPARGVDVLENLLAACKNPGVTHIMNGCYRLHPVEWNLGEAVGALAAFCVAKKRVPREVRKQDALLREFQDRLTQDGVPLAWPKVTPR